MNSAQLKVKQDVATRWNSTYIMLQRLIDIKVPISAVMSSLQKALQMLDADEWLAIEDCVHLLKPLDLMTTILSGEKYVTLSSIIPLVRGLQYSVSKINCVTPIGNKLKGDKLTIISRRFGNYERDKISAKATFLDSRYKKQGFGSKELADSAEKWVLEELGGIIAEASRKPPAAAAKVRIESDESSDTNMLWEYLDKKVADSNNVNFASPTTKAIMMVKQYLSIPNIPRTSNPLDFLSENIALFPELYKMHEKYLCTPATSVPSERIFSKTGIITNSRRNRLSPKILDYIVFLHINL